MLSKYDKLTYLFLALLAVLMIINLSRPHHIWWDEAVFIGLGKHIFSRGEIGLFEIIRPPGLPIALGWLWDAGFDPVFYGEIMMILFSLGLLLSTFLLSKEISSEESGFFALLIMSSTLLFSTYYGKILTGIPSTLLAVIGIYMIQKERYVFAGVLLGLSFITRYPQGIVFAAGFLYLLSKKRGYLRLGAGFSLVALPLFISNAVFYGPINVLTPFFEAAWHQNHRVYSVLDNSAVYNILYYPIGLIRESVIFLFAAFSFRNNRYRLLTLTLIGFLAYLTLILNKQIRFAIMFIPYLAVLSGIGLLKITDKARVFRYFVAAVLVVAAIAGISGSKSPYLPGTYGFDTYPLAGTVLSTNPVPIAYSDFRLIPAYNTVEDAKISYEMHLDEADYLIYSSGFYPCTIGSCNKTKEYIKTSMLQQGSLVYNETSDQTYLIVKVA